MTMTLDKFREKLNAQGTFLGILTDMQRNEVPDSVVQTLKDHIKSELTALAGEVDSLKVS